MTGNRILSGASAKADVARNGKNMNYTFTSESVCSGHPDKICDQISDAIVDAVLRADKNGRAAVETLATKNRLIIAGEVRSKEKIDVKKIAREQIKRLGYLDPSFDFWYNSPIDIFIQEQSSEIAKGVDSNGAGDQGMMFGFACTETDTYMPLPITLAHSLARQIDTLRETKILPYLYPDGKVQVSIAYKNGFPYKIVSVVVAVPHQSSIPLESVKHDIYHYAIQPIISIYDFSIPQKRVIVNGTGVWHKSGPAVDTGLTGRKIVVDTYGGYARVGGGCFSGKDPTKVDRSGAYAARFLAKNIVAAGLCKKAEVSLAYYIGARKPIMQEIDTFGTETVSLKSIKSLAASLLDTSVKGILETLDLQKPLYLPTAAYGHFGKNFLPWEEIAC